MARQIIIFIVLSLVQLMAIAQTDSLLTISNKYPIDDVVTYKGGEERLKKILLKNLKYPNQAVKDSISGTVIVYFTIDTNGHSTDIMVIKGIREDIDNEAIRCVGLLDGWNVGRHNGRKIKLHHIIPIKFSLSN